jgi:Tol biopolymer transport system component
VTRVGEPADYWQVRLSPSDTEAALTILDPLLRTLDVFVLPLTDIGFAPRRLSTALAADSDAVWSPRGDRVLYRSLQGGRPDLFARGIGESGTRESVVLRSDLDETPTDWRGRTILFHAPGRAGNLDVWAVGDSGGTPAALIHSGFNDSDARWSPDGRLLAYVSDESGQRDIYVESVEQGAGAGERSRSRVSRAGGYRPEWGADGRSLFFLRDGRVMRTDFAGGAGTVPLQFTAPREAVAVPDVRDYSIAHRSNRALMIIPVARSLPPAAGVIVNWVAR